MFCSPDSLLTRVDSSSEDYELYYELVQLLRQMLIWEGKFRPTADQALHSSFFKVGNPNPPLDKPYSCDSPVIFTQTLHPSHVERSCESLSICLQQDNPVKNLQRSPAVVTSPYRTKHVVKPWSQKGEDPSKEDVHQRSSLSVNGSRSASAKLEVYFSHYHKHRRVMTTPLFRREPFQLVSPPFLSSTSNGFITPLATTSPVKADIEQPLYLPNNSPSFSSPFSLPLRSAFSADDYRTPTPSALSLREGGLPQPPQFKETNSGSIQSVLRVSHPPSFDEISQNRSDSEPQGVLSPTFTPLSSLYSDLASFQVTKSPVF